PSGSSTMDRLVALKSNFKDLVKSQLTPYNLVILKFLLNVVLIGMKLFGSLFLKVFSEYSRFTSILKLSKFGSRLKLKSLINPKFLFLITLPKGEINS